MSTQVQYRRGTSAQNDAFTGALAEITVDTTNKVLRVHDGVTAGGFALAGLTTTQTLTNKTLSSVTITGTVTGNIIPSANITYNLGNTTNRFNDLYLANSTIYLGAAQISANATALILTNPGGGTTVLAGATASVTGAVVSASGNITGGNLLTAGLISATGNITGNYILGNGSQLTGIDATSIQSGTSNVRVVSSGGNVSAGVGGTSNVLVIASTGAFVTGLASVTGNITGGNLSGTNIVGTLTTAAQTNITSVGTLTSLNSGTISSSGNVTGANILTAGIVSATGNITGSFILGNGSALTGMYGNANVVANLAALSNNPVSTTGNITAGNFLTAGLISATGNITGGNVLGGANVNATTHTGTTVSVTGNVDSGNLRTVGLISATGSITTGGDHSLTGNIVDTGALTIITGSNGNITLAPNGTGVVVVNTDLRNGQANGVGNIGSATGYFNTVFAKATSAQYADVAEKYVADRPYTPGTVLEIGGAAEVQATIAYASTRIAGVISTTPALLMNSTESDVNSVELALLGRVPCRVTGTVHRGDLLTSSDLPGVATALRAGDYRPGCVIGKALQGHAGAGEGVIEVLVGRL